MIFNTVKLGEICKINQSSYSSKENWQFVNYLDTGNITQNQIDDIQYIDLSKEKLPSRAKRKVERNSIIFSTVRPNQLHYGIIKTQPEHFLVSTGFTVIDVNEKNANAEFIYYLLTQHEVIQHLQAIAEQSTSAYPSIKPSDIEELEITFPDIETQERISEILLAIDNKIALNTQINQNLEQQAQAIFKSWFVDFEPFGGVMPDNWNECNLETMCSLVTKGITPKYAEFSQQIVINQKCIRNHQIDLSLARYHNPKSISEKWLQYGDIVVNSTGTGTLGRTAQVLFALENLTVDSHVTIIRPKKSEYKFYLGLWAILHEHDFESLATGSTGQTDLPRERLKQMPLSLPDDNVLTRFTYIVKPICDIRVRNQQENQRLSALRDTLLPKLMNGEIDVSKVRI